MPNVKPQQGVTADLFVPFTAMFKAAALDDDEKKENRNVAAHCTDALAIAEGMYNGTIFTADELEKMVQRHIEANDITRLRICEEHWDTVGALLGRATDLKTADSEELGKCVLTDFDLFGKTQKQKDMLIQLEQAPDLLGLSICCSGDLHPVLDENGDISAWQWSNLKLHHIAICTWPACAATEGTIRAASYKTQDGGEFNPSIFKRSPTFEAMTASDKTDPSSQDLSGLTQGNPGAGSAYTTQANSADNDKDSVITAHYNSNNTAESDEMTDKVAELAAEVAGIMQLGASVGVTPNAKLIAGFTAEQRKAYREDLEKVVEKFNSRDHDFDRSPAADVKGAELSAGTEPDYEKLAADLIAGSGTFANFGKNNGAK